MSESGFLSSTKIDLIKVVVDLKTLLVCTKKNRVPEKDRRARDVYNLDS